MRFGCKTSGDSGFTFQGSKINDSNSALQLPKYVGIKCHKTIKILQAAYPYGEDLLDFEPSGLTRSRKFPVLKECCEFTLPPSFALFPLPTLPRRRGLGLGLGLFFLLVPPPKLKNLKIYRVKNFDRFLVIFYSLRCAD